VTTPSYAELGAAVRREGEGIVAAGKLGLDVPVPTCGDWLMRDLLAHIASVFHRAATVVAQRATEPVPWTPPAPDVEDPVGCVAHELDELIDALSTTDAQTPVWNWSPQPDVAAFWARRMAHEAALHRYDAQDAHGVAQPLDAELANDGFDELVDVLMPRVLDRDGTMLPVGTFAFVATDEGSWHVRTGAAVVERLEVDKAPDVTVRGTASALLLAAYNRGAWAALEVEGDIDLLAGWSAALRF
jgi:uncharacterized protein (TIGR03083 family)